MKGNVRKMQNGITEIFDKLKETRNDDEKIQDCKVLTACLNSFGDYFNHIVKMNIYSKSVISWTSVSEYMYKHMDEERRNLHDVAIQSCREINEICKKYNIPLVCDFDIDNRYKVAEFIACIITNAYLEGIHCEKSFDELVEEYSNSGRQIANRDYKEWARE
ncbi:MAG: DUF3232 domain-containing protein [Muribaculaceae bacterium]|nr:DUF3232 domain-containing protein [Muribaculaceae bacterium]MCM1492460.1 DUF3232 domain-containing protein [Muribaculaceae bacterium]